MELECGCGWSGNNAELMEESSATYADSWWVCPKCGGDASKMKVVAPDTVSAGE